MDFDIIKNMKSQDKSKAFDIIINEYIKAQEDTQGDFNAAFANILNWCVKWFG